MSKNFIWPLKLADTRGELIFDIELPKPFVLRQTRIPLLTLDQQKSLKDTIGELLNFRMIMEVVSDYASPIVIVKKKTAQIECVSIIEN
jgi:hypothetical protein